jgi:hypothetical protein
MITYYALLCDDTKVPKSSVLQNCKVKVLNIPEPCDTYPPVLLA